ncbi:unnamed protein product [Meloidogyne enterolobii]|uniref:Uncharacterized protein n=1 Tax=Meloidogyne enterolobii TaxID=390850 RepID=A0ACB0XNW0_MELEN
MYDLKRYARRLRNSRNELESNQPKVKPQFDHSHLLPELPPLNPSQNRQFNENTQTSLKSVYANTMVNSYRNRPPIQSNLFLNPPAKGQFSLSPVTQEEAPTLAYPTKSKPNTFYSPQHPIVPESYFNETNCSNSNKMNKFNPLAIPPGFSPLEEINVEKNPNDLNNQMSEEIIQLPKLINEKYEEIHINSEESTPFLISTSPPDIPPLSHPIICSNNTQHSTSTSEDILEGNEKKNLLD